MPRVVRDSDEETETKSCIRRTRASASIITDSPLRRNTRSNKQLTVIESSPESLDDSIVQSVGPTTRSRVVTLDKGMAATVVKGLRSRKVSGSSDVSESVEVESETVEKRITRRIKTVQSLVGTPTKTNLRFRNIRAGSEAKSTPPPLKNKRVTRSSSVDPVSNLNESSETPIKRKTRASIVPTQPTVTEDEEIKNNDCKSLESTVIEINDDSESSMISSKEKSIKNSSNTTNHTNKDTNIKESFNNSEKFTLDSSKTFEESMTNKIIEESTNKPFIIPNIDSTLESSKFEIKPNVKINETGPALSVSSIHQSIVTETNNFSLINNQLELDNRENITNSLENNSKLNNDENEQIDVKEFTETSSIHESIIQVDNIESNNKFTVDHVDLNIKKAYVKLDRTNKIETLMNQKIDENKSSNEQKIYLSNINSTRKESMLKNVKSAIVLVNDFIKNNENLSNTVYNRKVISSSLEYPQLNIENSEIDINYKDNVVSSMSLDDETENLIISANENEIENPTNIDNHNVVNNCSFVNNTNDGSNNSISMSEHSNTLKNLIITNDFNGEINNSTSVNINNEIEKSISKNKTENEINNSISENKNNDETEHPILINKIENEISNSISANENKNEAQCSILINKNMSLTENSMVVNVTYDETECLVLKNKNENENVNPILVKESNIATYCTSVNPLNDETKMLVSVNEKCDKSKNILHSIESIKSIHICNEKNNFVLMRQDNNEAKDSVSPEILRHVTLSESVSENKLIDKSSNISIDEENQSIDSISENQINNKVNDSDYINDKMDCTSFVIERIYEMDTDQKCTEPIPENVVKNINNEAVLEPTEFNIPNEIDTDSKQSKICGIDKNSVSSAVTDADGENAFTPTTVEETNEFNEQDRTEEKSLKKKLMKNSQKCRSNANDSDSNDSADHLFQDIPADEWFNEIKQNSPSYSENLNKIQNKSETPFVLKEFIVEEDNDSRNNNKKSLNKEKQVSKSLQQKSNDEVMENESTESFSKKARKSMEKNQNSNQSIDPEGLKSKVNISEIQVGYKLVIQDEIDSDEDENKSNKNRQFINKSLSLNQSSQEHKKDDSISRKNYRSVDTSLNVNQSSFEQNQNISVSKKLRTSMNNSKTSKKECIIDTSQKFLTEQIDISSSDDVMEIDEERNNEIDNEENDNISIHESQKEFNKSQLSRSKNKRMSQVLSTSLNKSKTSEDLLTNNSFSVSVIEDQSAQNSNSGEVELIENSDNNKNKNEEENDEAEIKNCKSLNKYKLSTQFNHSDIQKTNDSLFEKLSDSLNNSTKSKHTLLEKLKSLNESPYKSLINDEMLKNGSDIELEVEEDATNSSNKKSNKSYSNNSLNKSPINKLLNLSRHDEQTVLNTNNEASCKNKNKLLKETSFNKSVNESKSVEYVSSETKAESIKDKISVNKSSNKSLNISTKSRKSINNASIMENIENMDESNFNSSLSNKEAGINQDNDQNKLIDTSILKNTERVKFINPVKQDLLTTIQTESNSESEDVPECKLQMTDTDESDTSEDEDDYSNKDIDSDISKEYNLSGKITEKYSDDDVRGDVCRASEEEFSDTDDDGNDLCDFILPDHECENTDDESEDEEKSNNSIDSEDNENTEEIKTIDLIKEESVNNSKLNKNESGNNSKLKKNESFKPSKSIKSKNEISESYKSKAKDSISVDDKNTNISDSQYSNSDSDDEDDTKNCTSRTRNVNIMPLSSESVSEDSEDSYHVITVDQTDTSCSHSTSSKTKKLTPLIECSTPKPGVFVDRHSLPNAVYKSNSTRRKSESLNDLSDTKMVSSRLSIAENASKSIHESSVKFKENIEMVNSPETVIKNRQAWKLIPLNQTAHTLSGETPVTKYLKKSKLNDSAPSEWRKSDSDHLDVLSKNNGSTSIKSAKSLKKIQEAGDETIKSSVNKKSKKRKLQDMSNLASINDESILKAKKKKKRAHNEESVIEEVFKWEVENKEPLQIQKHKKEKKKSHANLKTKTEKDIQDATISDIVVNEQLTKKKKQKKLKEIKIEEHGLKSPQTSDDKLKKKKTKEKRRKAFDVEENAQDQELLNIEETKQKKKKKKKKMDIDDEEFNLENLRPQKKPRLSSETESHKKLKKSKRKNKGSSDDKEDEEVEDHACIDFNEARSSIPTTKYRKIESIRSVNQALKKQKMISNEKTSLKRLPDDVLEDLSDQPVKRSNKRQKLSNNVERKVVPSTSMFSPGKRIPVNLRVDDGYMPLNVAGGTTEFGVVNLEKATKVSKKTNAILNFRERMLSRNLRQPTSEYIMYMKKQKCKNSI